ncbi:hypothetical protein MNBD_GAMMA25-368 [hydrothermal vent metagenome]|uniref:Lipoprotein n=1 Tax=hydrothermal vent metagenome TaxID=652676 RepID=A0A3B1ANH9_9ZZZZ
MKNIQWGLFIFTGSLLAACGGGSGDDGNNNGLTVPAGAVTITSGNAVTTGSTSADVAVSAPSAIKNANITGGITLTQPSSLLSTTDLVLALRKQLSSNAGSLTEQAVVSGIEINESCDFGGSISGTYEETATRTNGTVKFNDCKLFSSNETGLNGSLIIDFQEQSNADYSAKISGNFSFGIPEYPNISYQGLDFSATGNDDTGDYSIRVDVAVSGIPGGGFLFQTTQNFTGNDNSRPDCPTAGQFLVTGAEGTQLRATSAGTEVTVEFNDGSGTFVEVAASPVDCTEIYD